MLNDGSPNLMNCNKNISIHSGKMRGFIHTERNDSIALFGDSLTTVLDSIGKYDEYFELKRVVIRSHILRGESRIAVAQSDMMYSKAQANETTNSEWQCRSVQLVKCIVT